MKPRILLGQELQGGDGLLEIVVFTTGDDMSWASPRCKPNSASAQDFF